MRLSLLLALLLPFAAFAGPYEDALQQLKNQYSAEVQKAGELTQWADSAYRLSFSDDNHNPPRQFVGNVLRALDLQEKTVTSSERTGYEIFDSSQ